jgi:hypothetical protein
MAAVDQGSCPSLTGACPTRKRVIYLIPAVYPVHDRLFCRGHDQKRRARFSGVLGCTPGAKDQYVEQLLERRAVDYC